MGDSERKKEEQYSNILSDFVACTGIQDEGQAIRYLENVNWDLLAAINLVMPQHSQRLPSEAAANLLAGSSGDVEMITIPSETMESGSSGSSLPVTTFTNPDASIITIAPDDDEDDDMHMMPSSSLLTNHRRAAANRSIKFKIMYNRNSISVTLPDTKTVHDLKLEVFSKTGIQVCKQLFKGWPHNELIVNDKVSLASLKLPSVLELTVDNRATPLSQNGHSSNSFNDMKKKKCDASDSSRLYKLNIADLTNGREYNLKYGGNTKVSAVKDDIATLSKIPVEQQVWTGWSDPEDEDSDQDGEDNESERDRKSGGAGTSQRKKKEDRDSLN
uniref:FAS-associated factor 1 n=1 Tax=Cacopsylla melanoneura TaxID=428564 RepID=A0A8D8SJW3_9HEMI